ncbi:dTMP kinase [Arthrobacter sp. Br18]|uniref:dTMP kinase n=1 Tax=Arthrobacter sp. Br18 TaxID=1312954 RepID=UPI0004ADE787|nr:dTMP kinase [Arthrobacter sp. Br18]
MTPEKAHGLPGLFVAFEGGDGAGKSTQASLLCEALRAANIPLVRTREPGGTPVGEKLRSLVLEHGQGEIDARTEALLFAASRAAHVAQVILPALARGDVVVCDRYVDSSVAYQGAGRELGAQTVLDVNLWAVNGLRPDLTVLLDVEPAEGRSRRTAQDTPEDRMESEPDPFHERIRAQFLDLAGGSPDHYLVLPADGAEDQLGRMILDAVTGRLA